MRWIVMRTLCVILWLTAAGLGSFAVTRCDWRLLIGQIAQALLAVVLWFAMPPGAGRLQAPTFGTRGLRLALYGITLATAVVATSRWPGPLDDSRGSDATLILFFATVVIAPFLRAERRAGPGS